MIDFTGSKKAGLWDIYILVDPYITHSSTIKHEVTTVEHDGTTHGYNGVTFVLTLKGQAKTPGYHTHGLNRRA